MNLQQKSAKDRGLTVTERVVLVAVKFSLEIQRNALVWALTHVAQPGDCVKLLVIISPHSSSKKLWSFPRFHSDCTVGHSHGSSFLGTSLDQKDYITDSCTQMMLELHQFYDPDKIKLKVKVVLGSQHGIVAAEAKRSQTTWVILDKGVKKEAKCCMEQLDCNIVVMKKSHPKVLRLNLIGTPVIDSVELSEPETYQMHVKEDSDRWNATQVPNVTPVSSPEHTSFTATDIGTSSISSLDLGGSPKFFSEIDWNLKKDCFTYSKENHDIVESDSDTHSEKLSSPSTSVSSQQWVADILSSAHEYSKYLKKEPQSFNRMLNPMFESSDRKFSVHDRESEIGVSKYRRNMDLSKNVRDVVSLTTKSPPDPPALCSVCQHKAPVFGKPPRWFTYAELEQATGGFSQANFLAEGGYGSVHRGVLLDGQVIAVKQHKSASSQGDNEFCSEVEVLSCAQHRNVVMLIGFCVEGGRRLLVYEFICNGSLDAHLYGCKTDPLDWSARQKIAVGAARGLRYLHEECRVGCIIHRDLRPNNILLTHDFEPLVGDFGLARWQPDGEMGFETTIIGTFGYLAPEYAQSGQITEKADVYAFGIVLIELVTGRKAVDINRPQGQQCLTEWARPLLEQYAIPELIDPLLRDCYTEQEVKCMIRCASSCIQRDPHSRPRMSQVLRMLEGDGYVR
ncbi:hypothetical protein ACH5RR_006119 [Cinchona calisaya]|uniref:Protein kinase domain-containing protein n=1 Tax=Cinchona calisaya TaxID=153742 RepID=A0ABD3AN34_9GENT